MCEAARAYNIRPPARRHASPPAVRIFSYLALAFIISAFIQRSPDTDLKQLSMSFMVRGVRDVCQDGVCVPRWPVCMCVCGVGLGGGGCESYGSETWHLTQLGCNTRVLTPLALFFLSYLVVLCVGHRVRLPAAPGRNGGAGGGARRGAGAGGRRNGCGGSRRPRRIGGEQCVRLCGAGDGRAFPGAVL